MSKKASTMDVRQTDSNVSLVVHPSDGVGSQTLELSGTLLEQHAIVARSGTRVEGLRDGGHTFWVSSQTVDTAEFVLLIATPPVEANQREVTVRGGETLTFRETNESGTVFTTCVVGEAITGVRRAP